MSIIHSPTLTYNDGNTTINIPATTLTGQDAQIVDDSIPASTTNRQYTFGFTRSKLQGILLYVTGVGVTVKTNSTSSPDNTIALTAGVPFFWQVNCGVASTVLFAADVTTIYVTNADGSTAAAFKARAIATA